MYTYGTKFLKVKKGFLPVAIAIKPPLEDFPPTQADTLDSRFICAPAYDYDYLSDSETQVWAGGYVNLGHQRPFQSDKVYT